MFNPSFLAARTVHVMTSPCPLCERSINTSQIHKWVVKRATLLRIGFCMLRFKRHQASHPDGDFSQRPGHRESHSWLPPQLACFCRRGCGNRLGQSAAPSLAGPHQRRLCQSLLLSKAGQIKGPCRSWVSGQLQF